VFHGLKLGLVAAILFVNAAVPADAQKFSDSYSLLEAVKKRDGAKAEALLGGRATTIINTKDMSTGDGALHIVARERDRSWNGETPLIMAVQRRDVPMVRLLLSKGADPKRTDNVAGYSALDYAKQDKRSTAVLKLLEAPPAKPERPVAGPKL
jgi:hypothetical protein